MSSRQHGIWKIFIFNNTTPYLSYFYDQLLVTAMKLPRKENIVISYTVYGLLAGLFFPLGALFLATILNEVNFTVHGLVQLHRKFPIQYLIDLIPVISTLAGYYLGV